MNLQGGLILTSVLWGARLFGLFAVTTNPLIAFGQQATPPFVAEFQGSSLDGTYAGSASISGSSCATAAKMKLVVASGSVVTDQSEAWYGSKRSSVYGVIHQDKSIDVVVVLGYPGSRSGIAIGKVTSDAILLIDGAGCTYSFFLKREQ